MGIKADTITRNRIEEFNKIKSELSSMAHLSFIDDGTLRYLKSSCVLIDEIIKQLLTTKSLSSYYQDEIDEMLEEYYKGLVDKLQQFVVDVDELHYDLNNRFENLLITSEDYPEGLDD